MLYLGLLKKQQTEGHLFIKTAAAILAITLLDGTPAQAAQSPTGGGSGGVPYSFSCQGGYLLRGVRIRSGSFIDGVAPICVEAKSYAANLNALQTPKVWAGGSGGEQNYLTCDNGNVVHAIEATSGMVTDHIRALTHFALRCSHPASPGNERRTTPRVGGPDKPSSEKYLLSCSPDMVAIGIYGRAGKWLDQIGLICDHAPPSK